MNPPLNIDLHIIFIILISYNITFGPSHPHRIDVGFVHHTKTKLPTNKSQKGVYAIVFKEGCMLLGP